MAEAHASPPGDGDDRHRQEKVAEARRQAQMLVDASYPSTANVTSTCDLVMKGGITSGVVYPLAACELADTYRFCNLGGSSAGAIAAAVVAAAEYGRDTGGFNRLAAVPDEIGSTLPLLFKPGPHTATAHQALMQWLDKTTSKSQNLRAVWRVLVRSQRRGFLSALAVGMAVALAVAFIGAGLPTEPAVALRFVFLVVLIALLAIVGATIWVLLRELRITWGGLSAQGFGICVGSDPAARVSADAPRPPASSPTGSGADIGGSDDVDPGYLTDWLAAKIDGVAGVDRPLTFGDLESRGINLRVTTTNLTSGRALTFPFTSSIFYFEADELSAYFPPAVIEQLLRHDRDAQSSEPPLTTDDGRMLHRLPPPADLPVVMAARMSLSFPGLISAVPLWVVDFSRRDRADQRPVRCWFSDGGITSNFPLHLFDAPWPRRPTFAIDLRGYHVDYPESDVYYAGRRSRAARVRPIENPLAFGAAILDTMQYWADDGQAELPGFRDRIVELHLHAEEGGMNLTMDRDTIAVLADKGRRAAAAIKPLPDAVVGTDDFGEHFDFLKHRVARFATTVAHLQEAAAALDPLYRDPLPDGSVGYRDLMASHPSKAHGGRGWNPTDAQARVDELVAFGLQRPPDFIDHSPRPRGKLRIRPDM